MFRIRLRTIFYSLLLSFEILFNPLYHSVDCATLFPSCSTLSITNIHRDFYKTHNTNKYDIIISLIIYNNFSLALYTIIHSLLIFVRICSRATIEIMFINVKNLGDIRQAVLK